MTVREQKRGRKIAMTDEERNAFLASERTCRVGTVGADGAPHVVPLWFVWDNTSFWLYSIVKSQRWTDLLRDPRVSIVVDAGIDYFELRGVEIIGTAVPVGEIPRVGEPNEELAAVEALHGPKYGIPADFSYDQRHAWLKVTPSKIVSWDFRKLASL